MASSGGGVFLPNDPPPSTGQVLTTPTIASPTITGTVAISGTTTLASGATLTTPTILFTAGNITATGVTGTNAAALSAVTPALYTMTGASGAGVALPGGTGSNAGAFYVLKNMGTGVLNVYAVAGTINGTTGTTAYAIGATGNLTAVAYCTVAGAWQIAYNT